MKLVKLFLVLSLLILILIGCSEKDLDGITPFSDDQNILTLNGTWKVISFEDSSNQTVETKTEENSWGHDIVITFDDTEDPGEVSGKNTTNDISGEFEYTTLRSIKIKNLSTTKVNQPDWGDKFYAALLNDNLLVDFEINNDSLKIYYQNKSKSVTLEKQ